MNTKFDESSLSDLYYYKHVTWAHLEVDCYLEYEAPIAETDVSPPSAETMTLVYALVSGIDIYSIISEVKAKEIEQLALEEYKEADQANADYETDDDDLVL